MNNETQDESRGMLRAVGLDVHPDLFTVAEVAGANAAEAKVSWVVDRRPLDQLEKVLSKRTRPGDTVVLEATGNAFEVAARILRCGRNAVVLNSEAVSDIGRKYCVTDKEDAVKLGRAWLTGYAKVVWQPDPRTADYRHLFFAHQNAVADAVRARNRVWAFLDEHCLKRPPRLALHDPRAPARLLALRDWSALERELLGELVAACRATALRRRKLEAQIAALVLADQNMLRLTRLLGVRHLVAFALYAFIGDIHRFPNPKSLAAYFGLSPSVCASGRNQRLAPPGTSHAGRKDVRALLVQGAQSVLRAGRGPLSAWGVQLKMRRGANVAAVAIARKMVTQVWYLLMGFVPQLTEVPQTLRAKIHKMVGVLAREQIHAMGHATAKAYEEAIASDFLTTA